ncbi:tetratricopeptide repeat protein [Opitutus terrae]|uniref:protein O-GlcNAc transferase n=1 Tax=Opitutus terrae (strain DSM 11246 / JCM 15787 / PB90-1) TaxID=452637 RepID=B1ZRQ8_OPITP|nr:tetratricopeptide repeat protein [Opitutus terrae]ACB73751.1 Tetratricopeptide TPR_2 repeat protein [Opitutus terrae PB90-1]
MTSAKLISLLQAGAAHHRAGRLVQAEAQYRQAVLGAPKSFEALHLLGLVNFQLGRMAEAADLLQRALRVNPQSAPCAMQLGMVLVALGRHKEAEAHLRGVVTRQPQLHEAWTHLAHCLKTQNRLREAIDCYQKAIELEPKDALAWYNYGLTLSLAARPLEALACHERALAIDPHHAEARFGRAQALQQTNRIPEAVEDYGRVLARQPGNLEARSYRLFALHYLEGVSRDQLFAEHVEYGRIAGGPTVQAFKNVPDPNRRLRVGVLSPDFRLHACAYFIEPLLQHLNPREFELCLYHNHPREDEVTARFRTRAAVWRNFVGRSHSFVEATIREDAPDVLIDLAGHTGFNRLPIFAHRLAPVQITYLGYPDTTGVAAMDYRFTDALADPPGEADALATEKLVRFAPTAWAYLAPPDSLAPNTREPAADGSVVFGSFNNLSKITDSMLAVWGRLLKQVPNGRLLLKGVGLSEPESRGRYVARMETAGLPVDRVELLERTPDTAAHLALYHRVDVALDTFPYHGTTTTCEALWMGVPVVTLAGDRHSSRVGVSLLSAVGHSEWIAHSADDYVAIALALAADPARRAQLRRDLREGLKRSPLLDHPAQAARFAAGLRQCWGEWCLRHGALGT